MKILKLENKFLRPISPGEIGMVFEYKTLWNLYLQELTMLRNEPKNFDQYKYNLCKKAMENAQEIIQEFCINLPQRDVKEE